MKVKFNSKLFKYSINNEEFDFDKTKPIDLFISDDLNFPKLNSQKEYKLALQDFLNISDCVFDTLSMSGIPEKLIVKILENKNSVDFLSINNTTMRFSSLRSINLSEIQFLTFGSINKEAFCEPERFENAKQLENLKELKLDNCSGLDISAFFEDLPNPQNLTTVDLVGELPDPEMFARCNNIEDLFISNIDNPYELAIFLSKIHLENLMVLNITNCNMSYINENIIQKLTNLYELKLTYNYFANFNRIMNELPNPEKLEKISFNGNQGNDGKPIYNIDTKVLSKFTNLSSITFSDLIIDTDEFHEYLLKAENIENVSFEGMDFEGLYFLKDVNPNICFAFKRNKGIDINCLTPDIARAHKQIFLLYDSSRFNTYSKPENKYDLSIKTTCDNLYHMQSLVQEADIITDAIIDIHHRDNGVNQILVFLDPYTNKLPDGYEILLEDYSITPEDVFKLNRTKSLKSIYVASIDNEDRNYNSRFKYSPELYNELYQKIQEITGDIPKDLSELDKFMIIYRRIGTIIKYDNGIVGKNIYSKYAKDNIDNSRNSVNALLGVGEKKIKTCVCAGYADSLYNCLRATDIMSYKITGMFGGMGYHQWNKVILDGVIYNVDLTNDERNLSSGKIKDLQACLISEEEFSKNYIITDGIRTEAPKTYNRKKVKQALKRAMEFDNIKPKGPLETIKESFLSLFNKKKMLNRPTSEEAGIRKDVPTPSWNVDNDVKREVNEKASRLSSKTTNSKPYDRGR